MQARPRNWRRTSVAFALGLVVIPLAGPFVPGPLGAFALMEAVGFAAVVVRPGLAGFLACAAGLSTLTLINAALTSLAGVYFLALLFVLVAMAAGACLGTSYNRLRAQGLDAALHDRRVWLAWAGAILLSAGLLVSYGALTGTGSPP